MWHFFALTDECIEDFYTYFRIGNMTKHQNIRKLTMTTSKDRRTIIDAIELKDLLPATKKKISIEKMNQIIKKRGAKHAGGDKNVVRFKNLGHK